MAQKWNLQDIRPAEPRRRQIPQQAVPPPRPASESPDLRETREDIPNVVISDGTKKSNKNMLIGIVLFVVIIGGAIGLSALLGKTELTVYPEHREPNISAEFTAYPDKRDNALSYEIMTLESTSESQVKASGQQQVEEQAKGKIEIIKTTPGAERLIKNTRFRSANGLIFRIQESVVVPGSVKDTSGASVPGTIQVEVFADESGEEYNLAAGTKFDIPGFQENGFDELHKAITAVNREPLQGGFSGPQFKIDDNELSTARQALQVQLRDTLLARIEAEKPNDFIAFPGSIALTFNQLPAVEYGSDLVTIREQAILQIPLFHKTEIAMYLAKEAVATYEGGPVRIDDPKAITFAYSNPTTSSSVIANEPSLTFSLTGKPMLIWEYDVESLKKDLAGLQKTAVNNVISAYKGIEVARVHITPFWQRAFPENPDEIIVIESLQENLE